MHSSSSNAPTPVWLFWSAGLLGLVALAFGIYAYSQQGNETAADSVFLTLQMFHLHFHPLHATPAPNPTGSISPELQIARFAAAAVALGLVPGLVVVGLFGHRIRRFWVKHFWNHHVIVCGHCSRAMSLIADLQRHGRRVVFIGHCPDLQSSVPKKVFHFAGHAHRSELLREAGIQRADRLVALYEDDRSNLEILVSANKHARSRARDRQPLECSAHLQDTHLQGSLYHALGDTLTDSSQIRHRLFNYYEIVARNLACQYPLPETVVEDAPSPEHFIIIGFGSFGQNVALKLLKMGQQLIHRGDSTGGDSWQICKPRITVADRRGEIATTAFLHQYPAFTDQCDFQLIAADCEMPAILDLPFLAAADAPAKTSIIFCLENEAITLRLALLLQENCQRHSEKGVDAIYLRIGRPDRLGSIVEKLTNEGKSPKLIFFAADSEIFNTGAILGDSIDLLARRLHDAYNEVAPADVRKNNQSPAQGKRWEQLGEEERTSNREAADHMWAKLRVLGYVLKPVPPGEAALAPNEAFMRELREREDELARVEHYRWMTWKLIDGFRYGPERKVPGCHPDIRPYEELSPATQEKDKVIVRVIPELLKVGRLQAVKRG